jgi:hypothetical protein
MFLFSRLAKISRVGIAFALAMNGAALGLGHDQSDSPEAAHFDGPAELPRLYVKSSLADTPAPGSAREVKAGDDLQSAIDNAKCGETLKLQAGAAFAGKFRFPPKSCDDAHWIVLRTSAPDSALPPEGTRITPCYAGVASLPGRPAVHCASSQNVMAKIVFDGRGDNGPILFAPGANHYRFIGLEITRAMPEVHIRHLINADDSPGAADHLIFDRIWMHGTSTDETKDGLHLSGVTYGAIVDSYLSDFHCIALKGSCTDAQAVNGGTGDFPGGPYKIVNNFLEASGENILFGGGPGSTTPADIEIRRNHFFKPLLWMPGQPGFVGSYTGNPFIVKNHIEFKNAQRVLVEGNVFDNCWGGFSQSGFSILLNPGNQNGKCAACRVTDITIRYNKVSHVASAIQMATALPKQLTPSSGGERFSIHDLIFDDIDGVVYKGFGLFTLAVSVDPPLNNVKIDHVTAFPTGPILSLLNQQDKEKLKNFTITNNLLTAGKRQIVGAGGGPTNCIHRIEDPVAALADCLANPVFTHNLIVGGAGSWPSGNIVVGDMGAAGIENFHDGRGGDYRLCRQQTKDGCKKRSPGVKAGTDGKDIGADVDAVDAATAGVE